MKQFIAHLVLLALLCTGTALAEDLKRLNKIDANISKGTYDIAIKEGLAYTAQYPDSARGWNVVGWAYVKSNQLDQALDAFNKAIANDSKYGNAYVGKGVVYRKQNNSEMAVKSYQHAIAINPKNAAAYSSLLVIELQQGNVEKAVEYGEKAWHLNKKSSSIAANLAIAYHTVGNMPKRDDLYRAAKKLKYRNMAALKKRFGK